MNTNINKSEILNRIVLEYTNIIDEIALTETQQNRIRIMQMQNKQ